VAGFGVVGFGVGVGSSGVSGAGVGEGDGVTVAASVGRSTVGVASEGLVGLAGGEVEVASGGVGVRVAMEGRTKADPSATTSGEEPGSP
jgi:hypothetical protein